MARHSWTSCWDDEGLTLSLRNRIWGWGAGSVLAFLFAFFLIADNSFRRTIRRDVEESLRSASRLAVQLRLTQLGDLITRTSELAEDPTLKAAASTDDPATIERILTQSREAGPAGGPEWLAVLALDESVVATTPGARTEGLEGAGVMLADARFYDTGDVWATRGGLLDVAASPIIIDDRTYAILVAGRRVGRVQVAALKTFTGQPTAVFASDLVVASAADFAAAALAVDSLTLATDDGPGTLEGESATVPEAVQSFSADGEPFLGVAARLLSASGVPVGSLFVFRSLGAAMAPARTLRLSLLGFAAGGVAVAFVLGLAVAGTVTAPVDRLIRDAQRLGSGDLDHPIVAQRKDEIGRLAQGFDRMRVSLKRAQEHLIRSERLSAIGEMASSIVHDLSNPLAAIRMSAEMLEMTATDELDRETLHGIIAESDRLNIMMREVLEFARGEQSLDVVEADVGEWLTEIVDFWRPSLGQVALKTDLQYRGTWLFDPHRLRRVIDNLVKNAKGVMGASGGLVVRTKLTDAGLLFEVQDAAPGIPPEIQHSVFQPFVTHGTKGGTGLGLAISQSIVERHGGSIAFESRPGGTTFRVLISRRGLPTEADDGET